ncbi:DUF4158 domain-containing protein [Streptosporangium algeriense]|uniref:DUF4158 domain-containing protein n=1 Tax=Streptosporangium algeriense TaxID=1682748 RepID=A0ABW3DMI3_9ACTN
MGLERQWNGRWRWRGGRARLTATRRSDPGGASNRRAICNGPIALGERSVIWPYFAGMPVEFLTDDEAAAYGRFAGPPSRADPERVFFLEDEDRARVAQRRGRRMRLGFALRLVTVRWLGTFLEDPLDVPGAVLEFMAEQPEVEDPSQVKRYAERHETPFDHQRDIRRAYGRKDFTDVDGEFTAWVAARSWTSGDGPKATFTDGVGWLRERKCRCQADRAGSTHRRSPPSVSVPGMPRERPLGPTDSIA